MRAERLLAIEDAGTVCQATGLSIDTVEAIQAGRHRRQRERAELERCPDCGGLVRGDALCHLCRVRRLKGAA